MATRMEGGGMSEIGDKSDPRRRGRWIRFSRDSTPVAQEFVRASKLVPAHSAIPSCASEISDSREGEGRGVSNALFRFFFPRFGADGNKRVEFLESSPTLACLYFRIFSVPLYYSLIFLLFSLW